MKTVRTDTATLRIEDRLVTVENDEGINLDHAQVDQLIAVLNDSFGEEPYGYISHRIHSYSVNPLASRRIVQETSICVAGFVLKTRTSLNTLGFEKYFYAIPLGAFFEWEHARLWCQAYLDTIASSKPVAEAEDDGSAS